MINETDDGYEERIHAAYAKALDLKQMAGEAAHDFKERVAMSVNGARQAAASVRERNALESVAGNSVRTGAKLAERAARLVDETVESSIH